MKSWKCPLSQGLFFFILKIFSSFYYAFYLFVIFYICLDIKLPLNLNHINKKIIVKIQKPLDIRFRFFASRIFWSFQCTIKMKKNTYFFVINLKISNRSYEKIVIFLKASCKFHEWSSKVVIIQFQQKMPTNLEL